MKVEGKEYCHFCQEEHIVSETKDTKGKVVGLFCNRKKAIIKSDTTRWADEDIYGELRSFARNNVDTVAAAHIKPDKVAGLARKMAYLFLQTPYAKERRINYYFAQYHMTTVIARLRSELRAKKVGK